MPYRLIWEPEGLMRQYFGDVTIAERSASLQAICSDPRFDRMRYAITDYREAQAYETSPEATAEIAAMHVGPIHTNPRVLIAAVTEREDIIASIDEFRRLAFTQALYEIFPTLEEARRWVASHQGL